MSIEELARLVKETRDAQTSYFRTRSSVSGNMNLIRSKQLEARLDKTVADILSQQQGFFDA